MYGIRSNLNLNFLIGRTLVQICVGENDLVLNFDGQLSITVMSSIGCTTKAINIDRYEDFRKAAGDLFVFLNKTIQSATFKNNSTLILSFLENLRSRL